MRSIRVILLTAAGTALLAAEPAFEVAAIRPNTSGSRARSLGYPPNRFVATNMPLRWLIGNAYGDMLPVRQDMILGGPSWIDSDGFTFELHFTPPARVTPAPEAPPDPPADPDSASIFTAVQEQLGLKLEPQRGALDVLVVDGAGRPTPN